MTHRGSSLTALTSRKPRVHDIVVGGRTLYFHLE